MDHTHIGTIQSGGDVWLSADERREHLAAFGASGVGKSTLLQHLFGQDVARGDGAMLIDPHGSLAEAALALIPRSRSNQVCYFNLTDLEYPVGLNVLEDVPPDQRAVVVDGVVSALRSIWRDTGWGARMENVTRHACAALMEIPNASFILIPRLLMDDAFRERIVPRISDPFARQFFSKRFEKWRDTYRDEVIEPVLNKVEAFLSFPHIRNVLGQGRSTLHLEHAMREGRIVIVNLAKTQIGETAANLMGALLIGSVLSKLTLGQRSDFHLLIDEAHTFSTNAIAELLRSARKFRVSVTVVSQHLAAFDEETRAALLGTTHSLVCFRLGVEDAKFLAPHFNRAQQDFNPYGLQHLGRGEAVIRAGSGEANVIDIPLTKACGGDPETIKKQSRRHYGNRREDVERNIFKVLGHQV